MRTHEGREAAHRRLRAGPCRIHAAGIGGVGMAGLALLLHSRGFRVDGCDLSENRLTAALRAAGIPVRQGHDPDHLAEADWLVCTAALPQDHPERAAARARGIPTSMRGDVLAALAEGPGAIAVAGTHGKTTTSAMLAHILHAAGRDPTFAIGGELPGFDGAVARIGAGPDLVVEADESDGTLRGYRPGAGVITNIDFDHMEHFRDAAEFLGVFETFASRAGALWYGADHPVACRLGSATPGAIGFGLSAQADPGLRAVRVRDEPGGQSFLLHREGAPAGEIRIPLRGHHNVRNALAALGPALARGCPLEAARDALAAFRPPRRRFDRLYTGRRVQLVSDYAHHPEEIRALLQMARSYRPARLRAIFQPHRFTRTRALGSEFPPAFDGIDELLLVPVYAASETPLEGGTSEDLLRRFPADASVHLAGSPEEAWEELLRTARDGDLLLLVGAGDIERIAPRAVRDLAERFGPATEA